MDQALTDIEAGRLRRLIVEMPPRHGKSELIGRYFPAHFLARFPDKNVIFTSYEQKQAARYGRRARNIIEEVGGAFGVRVAQDSSAADRWNIAGREGGMVSVGMGGSLTGKGADLLIIDDPIKNHEDAASEVTRDNVWDWFQSTAMTRLEPNAAAVIVQTRWHRDDLAGRCQSRQREEGWRVLRLPALAEHDDPLGREPGEALWPERFPTATLERMRDAMDPYWWQSLYQQVPGEGAGAEWPADYFGEHIWFDQWPREWLIRVMALDPSKGKDAKRGDYSAFAMLQVTGDTLYVDCDMQRRPVPQIISDGVRLHEEFQPDCFGIEANAFQELLGGEFQAAFRARGEAVDPWLITNQSPAKVVRIRRLGPWLSQRRLKLRRNSPGARLLLDQLRGFPHPHVHDDGPDALEMALRLAIQSVGAAPADNVEYLEHL